MEPKLPPELIEEIMSCLPLIDRKLLGNFPPVARWWKKTSRRRCLFESVETPFAGFQSWLEGLPQEDRELLRYVLHLSCTCEKLWEFGPIGPVYDTPHGHIRPFHKLRHLQLWFIDIELPPQKIEFFSIFKSTLLRITLSHCKILTSVLLDLFDYFPELQWLGLRGGVTFAYTHQWPSRSFDRPPLKILTISMRPEESLSAFYELSELGLRFDEIALDYSNPTDELMEFVNSFIEAFGASAKCLRIHEISGGPVNLNLSSCCELREFELGLSEDPLCVKELDLISSIPSMNIKKITINYTTSLPVSDTVMARLNDIRTKMAERSGHEIELEFYCGSYSWRSFACQSSFGGVGR